MAEKYSVLIKYKYLEYLENANLSDNDAWRFIKAIVEYDKNGVMPTFQNPVSTALFAIVKSELDNPENKTQEGKHHWNWKGGITVKHRGERASSKYQRWHRQVFKRDNYTCQSCGKKGGKLRAHHIRSFARYSELRLAVDNGITYCDECHRKWHKEHGRGN